MSVLQSSGAISFNRLKLSHLYPDNICGVVKCGYSALFNVLGRIQYDMIIASFPSHNFSDLCQSISRSSLLGKDGVGNIYLLRSHHWVALSQDLYYDDAYCWPVVCHKTAHNILQCMTLEADSNTPLRCAECIHQGIPCVVSRPYGPHKQRKCDTCFIANKPCLFHPVMRISSLVKFPKSCIHCKAAHQTCTFGKSENRCDRCVKTDSLCLFAPSSQGTRNDLQRSPKNLTQIQSPNQVNVHQKR